MNTLLIDGDEAKCSGCGHTAVKNDKGEYDDICEACGEKLKMVYLQTDATETDATATNLDNGKDNKKNLSQNYSVLGVYKGLAYLLMFVNTAFTIYSFVEISEASKKYGGGAAMDNALITLIVTYVITMFSLFCLTKMIDFLFDLDKHKSDK